ncbi:MAG: TM1812 family CRISPR-associated protein [Thermus sp.]|nr:TM1812 family CRISPR-associated protein [Thermus sp.]
MNTKLLVALLGRRGRDGKGYESTRYFFQQGEGGFTDEASFFGKALFRYLWERRKGEEEIDLLLVGTTGSAWYYVEDFFLNDSYMFPNDWDDIASALKRDEAVSQESVDKVMEAMGKALSTRVRGLVLEDPPKTEDTYSKFMNAVQELYRDTRPPAEIHLDITHGYRYLPFVLLGGTLLLRHIWESRIFLHYGGLELRRSKGEIAPVVDLSLLDGLVELDESLSVLGTTGDFRSYFGSEKAQPTFLALETNQQQDVSNALNSLKEEHPPLAHPLVRDWVGGILEKLSGHKFEDKLANRARFFWKRGQYFKAVLLLYEAILVAGVKRFLPGKDPLNYEVRVQARDDLVGHIRSLGGEGEETYDLLRRVRNAIAHGTRPEGADAQRAAKDYKELEGVFKKGVALFEKLKETSS